MEAEKPITSVRLKSFTVSDLSLSLSASAGLGEIGGFGSSSVC